VALCLTGARCIDRPGLEVPAIRTVGRRDHLAGRGSTGCAATRCAAFHGATGPRQLNHARAPARARAGLPPRDTPCPAKFGSGNRPATRSRAPCSVNTYSFKGIFPTRQANDAAHRSLPLPLQRNTVAHRPPARAVTALRLPLAGRARADPGGRFKAPGVAAPARTGGGAASRPVDDLLPANRTAARTELAIALSPRWPAHASDFPG